LLYATSSAAMRAQGRPKSRQIKSSLPERIRLVQDRLQETAGPTATGCHLFPIASESCKTPDDLLLQIPFQPASIVQIEFLVGTGMSEAGNPCGTRLAAERGRPARKIRLQAMIFDCGVFLVRVAGGTPALRTA